MPRLQFSLRALLLAMAIVGATIVLYRWPWTETKVSGVETITTGYRRGWTGKPVKHGVQVTTSTRYSDYVMRQWYVDGELHRELEKFIEITDAYYRNQQLHGPYMRQSTTWTARGQYRDGKKVGRWKTDYADVSREDEWQADKLHGRRTWTTPHGRLLQSADFEEGRLIRWNGQPPGAELRRWLVATIADSELRRSLLETFSDRGDVTAVLSHGNLRFFRDLPDEHPIFRIDARDPMVFRNLPGNPLEETILSDLLEGSETLVYRFERFQEVPITPQHLDWQDRTGVYNIRFEAGSNEEQFWLGRGVIDPYFSRHTRSRLKGMLYAGSGIQIQFDTTAIDALEPPFEPVADYQDPSRPLRTRRALVGHYLDQRGYYCELRGSTLVFKPHPQTKREQEQ